MTGKISNFRPGDPVRKTGADGGGVVDGWFVGDFEWLGTRRAVVAFKPPPGESWMFHIYAINQLKPRFLERGEAAK
jgi:hypothetical protein